MIKSYKTLKNARAFFTSLVFFLPFSLWAGVTLQDLDEIVKRSDNLEIFLSNPALIDEYYDALADYFGRSHFQRESFNAILKQLRKMSEQVPALKKRLWETNDLGSEFKIESVDDSRKKVKFQTDIWKHYLQTLKDHLNESSHSATFSALSPSQKIDFANQSIIKRVKSIHDFEMAPQNHPSKKDKKGQIEAGKRKQELSEELKHDTELQRSSAFLLVHVLEKEFSGGNLAGEAILEKFEQLRKSPTSWIPSIKKNPFIERAFKNLLPSHKELISNAFRGVTEWKFQPVPRRIHGIWKGIESGECIGGKYNPEGCELELLPERWANVALAKSRLYYVERDGTFRGYIHEIQIMKKSDPRTLYASIDIGAYDFPRNIIALDEKTHEPQKPERLFETWYRHAFTHKPKEWKGYVIGDSGGINAANARSSVTESLSHLLLRKDLGEASGFSAVDPLGISLSGKIESKGIFGGLYLNPQGGMVFEANLSSNKHLYLLGDPRNYPNIQDLGKLIEAGLKDFHADIRRNAASALASYTRSDAPHLYEMAFAHEDSEVRENGVVALVSYTGPGALELFEKAFQHTHSDVAENLAAALTLYTGPHAVPLFKQAIEHSNWRVRSNALRALRTNQGLDSARIVEMALESPIDDVRSDAAFGLFSFRGPEALLLFKKAFDHFDSSVHLNAAEALSYYEGADVDRIYETALQHPIPAVRIKAVNSLSRYTGSNAFPLFQKALLDEHAEVISAAKSSLQKYERGDIAELYEQLLRSPQDLVKTRSAEALKGAPTKVALNNDMQKMIKSILERMEERKK